MFLIYCYYRQFVNKILSLLALVITVLVIPSQLSANDNYSERRDNYYNNISGMGGATSNIAKFNDCMQTRKGPCAMQDCNYWL